MLFLYDGPFYRRATESDRDDEIPAASRHLIVSYTSCQGRPVRLLRYAAWSPRREQHEAPQSLAKG